MNFLFMNQGNVQISIFPIYGIAFEYNGKQHHHYVEHFHKTIENFKYQLELDKQKRDYLFEHGIKIIDIDFDGMVNSSEELKSIIDNTSYPQNLKFIPLPLISKKEEEFKKLQKEKRKNESKYIHVEDPDVKKERLKKEKEFRQKRYKDFKEKYKK